ncbi:lipid particle protein [Ephemerocybe angulata]|uniref:Lipid particle protein n=1 Tax=Ephemerocybe angulata TaxID=980116 RepID=A0A8H6MAZ5_9AGAR|nr:lipid particle protein [Tulosesus angulatus]
MSPIHLLVLIHGMWGNPGHLAELQRIAAETYSEPTEDGTKLEILVPETNRENSTYDGVDWGGERVAKEILEKVEALEKDGGEVKKLSVTGYSLGGLVARYVVGILSQQGFFDKVTPVNFNTIATPHIGLPRYPSFISSVFSTLGPKLLSRTGEQFYCVDKWSPKGRPLLVVMADPERIFYQALTKFQHLRIYANAINDVTVPTMVEGHRHVIKEWSLPDIPPPLPVKPRVFSREWASSVKFRKPFLPPPLQFRFPFNLVVYTMLPVLIPTFISLVLVNFTLNSHKSKARIKLLENEYKTTNEQKLIHILAELEREVEDAIVDMVDSDDPGTMTPTSSKSVAIIRPQAHPILSTHQKKIANWLNTLPGLKKEMVFLPDIRNSHATIVSRDVKRFESHRDGEDVIRHWAKHLII